MRTLRLPTAWIAGAALLLTACAGPIPGAVPPQPGRDGTGPQCGPQQYPFQALANHRRGEAIVQAQVASDGRLGQPVLEMPAPDPYLTHAALQAARQCSLPAARAGSQVRLLVVFELFEEEYIPRGRVTVFFAPPPQPR